MPKKNEFNGWTNAATWAVQLKMREEISLNEYFIACAVAVVDTIPANVKGKVKRYTAAKRALSVILQDKITEMKQVVLCMTVFAPNDRPNCVRTQRAAGSEILKAMIDAGFKLVNWQEIAEDFLLTAAEYIRSRDGE
jgi:hypothetical protein